MKRLSISISVFVFLFFLSYTLAKEVSSAGPEKRDVELLTNNAVTICGEGTLYYYFTDTPTANCKPLFAATMIFYSNGTFTSLPDYGAWNSYGSTINWSYPPNSGLSLVTVYLGKIENGKMSGTMRAFNERCGCWVSDFVPSCNPTCAGNYY